MIDSEHPKDPATTKPASDPKSSDTIEHKELKDEQLSEVSGGVAVHRTGDPCEGGQVKAR